MSRDTVEVNPEILVWARERSGYDLPSAAAKADVSVDALRDFETGDRYPTGPQLRRVFGAYRLSPAVAFMTDVPATGFDAPRDFRSLPDGVPSFDPDMRAEIDRVRGQIRYMGDLQAMGVVSSVYSPIDFSISRDHSDDVAADIRDWLGMPSVELSAAGRDSRLILNAWIRAIETKGILVSQVSGIPVDTMRGFCIADDSFPMIVLNGADGYAPRLFTLLHELAHLLGGEAGVCGSPVSDDRTESRCNSVAAAVLIPKGEILSIPEVATANTSTRWELVDLWPIASRFGVSREAVLRRLLTLGKTSESNYRQLRRLLMQSQPRAKKKQGGGPDREVLLLRNLGRTYVSSVLSARERGLLTESRTADLLFAKVRWADPLATLLSGDY